jgi:23S rRNA pseudouridine1911/1915/1917 synthase
MLRLKGIDPLHRPFGRKLIEAVGRPALHAFFLALDHPATGKRLEWALEPPDDFQALLSLCRDDAQ